MIVVLHKKVILLNLPNPDRVMTVIPTARAFIYRGHQLVAVPHKIEESRVLKNLGYDTPSPIRYFYNWPGRFTPFHAQVETAAFLTMNGNVLVLNDLGTGKEREVGVIPVDSSFSPIKRVRHKVENTRVGKLTNYERLILEIWTNGTISPEEALTEASKILRKHLNPFVQYFELGRELQINEKKEEEQRKKDSEKEELRQKLSMSISELDLSVRSANCLASERIETIGELVARSEGELLKVRNFGKTSLREVKKKLSDMGLNLGMDLESIFGKKTPPLV